MTKEWEQAWLRYDKSAVCGQNRQFMRAKIVTAGYAEQDEALRISAYTELCRVVTDDASAETRIVLQCRRRPPDALGEEGFRLWEAERTVTVEGSARGVLYGVFALLRRLLCGKTITGMDCTERPVNPLRMLDHWDNFDGSIERGYSGNSFFFQNELLVTERTVDYARLAASVGINAVAINNVNVRGEAVRLITESYYGKLRALHEVFAAYGLRLFVSIDFAAPVDIGGLDTADPEAPEVREWWRRTAARLYREIPQFGGFLVKADSEGRPGPFTYGRTHADGANMLARALAPYGGIVIWRCFVYNCQQDWRDMKTDRARAGYDNFKPLDGQFDANVILQIKNGPMDFQVREPVSPLFGAMPRTNQMLEVQLAQEYTGQQKHVCYLIPWFQEVLSFKTYCRTHAEGEPEDVTTVAAVVSGRTYGNAPVCGICAVANTGDDANWTGHDLAAANWYGFGRLAWNPALSAEEIAREWAALTFGGNARVTDTVTAILLRSWHVYEMYNAPLGIGWMCNPNHHYGPNVDGYEYDRWGTYHRADCRGIGVDRSSRGTGYTKQYFEPNASIYDDPETCPEELLLFFHHMPYDYRLRSGETILQYIYNTHFEGAEAVAEMKKAWEALEPELPPYLYRRVLTRFEWQLESSREWRDVINSYFYRKTLVIDEKGRTIY